jgi:2-amino-4-hydroxy-6-hydroxymethyldihydropteridine diphosphokinase
VIGLGGNLGDPLHWFRVAARTFAAVLTDLEAAPLYRTEPVAGPPQPAFLNTVLIGATRLEATDLLAIAKALEQAAGRRPGPRHGPRPLDVDLLIYDDIVASDPELRLPHPAMRDRRFVLAPLADIAPELRLPPAGRTVRELESLLPRDPGVERLGPWL